MHMVTINAHFFDARACGQGRWTMTRLDRFFAHAPKAVKSAGHQLRSFANRPMGKVLIGAGIVLGIGALTLATAGTAHAATPAMLAATSSKSAGLWKAFGFTALAVGYIYGQVQMGLALSRAMENRDRERQAKEAKKKAREEMLEKLKRDLHHDDAKPAKPNGEDNTPPKAARRRPLRNKRIRLPQPA